MAPSSNLVDKLKGRTTLVSGILRCASGPAAAARALSVAARGRGRDRVLPAVAIPMRALGGEPIYVRPGTSDLVNAVAYYGAAVHMPPPGIADPRRIVELGTNSGVALTALAIAFPEASLLGVEPGSGNVAAARRNVARFGERCEVVQAAIWDETVELTIDESSAAGEHGFVVRPLRPGDPPEAPRMRGMTIDDILSESIPAGERVDYMHITIEGSEPRVLEAGGEWPERVDAIRIELHPYFGFEAADCIRLLEQLGYEAWLAPDPPDKWVFAVQAS
jgi:FkbM family methyltransferase